MKAALYKTIEISQEELYVIEGGSLTEVAYAIWEGISFCFTLNARQLAENERYMENFHNH